MYHQRLLCLHAGCGWSLLVCWSSCGANSVLWHHCCVHQGKAAHEPNTADTSGANLELRLLHCCSSVIRQLLRDNAATGCSTDDNLVTANQPQFTGSGQRGACRNVHQLPTLYWRLFKHAGALGLAWYAPVHCRFAVLFSLCMNKKPFIVCCIRT